MSKTFGIEIKIKMLNMVMMMIPGIFSNFSGNWETFYADPIICCYLGDSFVIKISGCGVFSGIISKSD
jgi:hypothetical protein